MLESPAVWGRLVTCGPISNRPCPGFHPTLNLCSLLLYLAISICTATLATPAQADCISPEEQHLFTLINNYRAAHRLPRIPMSASLTLVARTHVRDLAANHPAHDPCNLHSWSRKGAWTPCCYTSNHRAAKCMWEKPREIAGYPSDGYEIASEVWPAGPAEEHMEGWKSSEAHHAVILNRGTWSDMRWQAMGVGIFEGYAVVWFGTQLDPKRPPEPCRADPLVRAGPPGPARQ